VRMRPRDIPRLESVEYDVLVVGGGIHGLAVAHDAASRGLRVALVESKDFGSGTSFNHQKTAHGGLRSLSSGNVRRARLMIRERRALARIAPWFLRPLPFIVGTYRSATRGRSALRAAFAIDRWLSRRRNEGVDDQLHLPAPKLLSKSQTLKFFPGIAPHGLTGGAQWYDYQMVEGDRLTLAFAASADAAGADLANYAEATAALQDGTRISGMAVRDAVTGRSVDVRARVTINAAGAHAGTVMAMFGVQKPLPLLKAMNLVTAKPMHDIALAAPATDGRMLTLVPWRGRAIVGTSQSAQQAAAGDTAVSAAEVSAFVDQANAAFPALKLTPADVTLVHRGVVPAAPGGGGALTLLDAPQIFDHAADNAPGAISLVGVKYVLARSAAERAVDAAASRLGRRIAASRTAVTPLTGAGIADHEGRVIETARKLRFEIATATIRHLAELYAERAADIVRLMASRDDLRDPVAGGVETVGAEVVHVIREEMALHLTDIVIRRTGLGAAGHPGAAAVARCARLAATELNWTPAQEAEEIAAVDRAYAIA
jgi:glycerol-3-phosphate dehydrogenase